MENDVLEVFARIGYEIERRLGEAGTALLLVIFLWVFWATPLDTIVATALIALAYYRFTRKKDPPPLRNGFWVTVLGILLVVWGVTSLTGVVYKSWELGLIFAGLLLIILGVMGGEGSERGSR